MYTNTVQSIKFCDNVELFAYWVLFSYSSKVELQT